VSYKKYFDLELKKHISSPKNRTWVYLAHDQLNDQFELVNNIKPSELGIILIESRWWARRRPYHKLKLALVWANQRQFALEQAKRGVAIIYRPSRKPLDQVLEGYAKKYGPIKILEPAEREMRVTLERLINDELLLQHKHDGWLTERYLLEESQWKDGTYKMDSFYRRVRKEYNVLMDGDDFEGGKVSFDGDNRLPWKKGKDPEPPKWPEFKPDKIDQEVEEMIHDGYNDHPGELDMTSFPTKKKDIQKFWKFFLDNLFDQFGPYEDAMTQHSSTLFHSRMSPLMNIFRIMPLQMIQDVEKKDVPINSKEGFIRQVIGWREFMYHLHFLTDAFRDLPEHANVTYKRKPGDGGFEKWSGDKWEESEKVKGLDGGSKPSYFESDDPVPPAYWGTESGLNCLDSIVKDVWREGYSHHITRLMVLSNLATLLEISPRELTDWFWVAYADAWEWVVEPNVLAMGTYATGPFMTTKPYVAGSSYINRMSDYCSDCAFDPKKDCPIGSLYWAFLGRHEEKLKDNHRMRMIYNTFKKRSAKKRQEDQDTFEEVRKKLQRGKPLVEDEFFGEASD